MYFASTVGGEQRQFVVPEIKTRNENAVTVTSVLAECFEKKWRTIIVPRTEEGQHYSSRDLRGSNWRNGPLIIIPFGVLCQND